MRATCRIVVAAGPGGSTRIVTAAGIGPLTPRRTGPERIHLVAGAGGPLGGDDSTLEVTVGAGASLELCSAAASIVLAADGAHPSRLTVRATVAEGGELVLTPGTVLLTRRGRHECRNEFAVDDGARLLVRELLVLGRSGEVGGTGSFTTHLDVAGRPVVRQTVRLGPAAVATTGSAGLGTTGSAGLGATGSAVLAGGRVLGQLLVAGAPSLPGGTRGPRAAWLPSAVPGCGVFTLTDVDPAAAARLLDEQLPQAFRSAA